MAAQRLRSIGDASAVEPLIAALQDPSDSVRLEAVRGLSAIRDVRAVDPLIEAVTDPITMMEAIGALAVLGDSRAVRPLANLLRRSDLMKHEYFRGKVLAALEGIGGPDAEAALVEYRARPT